MEWIGFALGVIVIALLVFTRDEEMLGKVFLFCVCSIAMLMVCLLSFVGGQKDGQIDALTGDINYELVTKPDSTRVWEEIKK